MSLFRSPAQGFRLLGWRPMLHVSLGLCLGPAVLGGAICLVLPWVEAVWPQPHHEIWASIGFVGLISPLITGPLLFAIAVCAATFMQGGSYGVISTLGIGGLLGLVAEWQTGIRILPYYGMLIACLQRVLLALSRPLAF